MKKAGKLELFKLYAGDSGLVLACTASFYVRAKMRLLYSFMRLRPGERKNHDRILSVVKF